MKKIIAALLVLCIAAIAAATDQRIQYTERMVGAGHPTLTDTLNRLTLVEHGTDGTHTAATTTVRGTASFSSTFFTISSGAVSLATPTQLVTTSTRTVGGVYQNSSGKTMDITACVYSSASTSLYVYSDAVSTPTTTIISGACPAANVDDCVSWRVITGNYYKLSTVATGTVRSWVETY